MTLALDAPATQERHDAATPATLRTGVIDCDVHPTVRSLGELNLFLPERWRRHLRDYGLRPRHGFIQGDPYPKAAPRAARRDAWAPAGGPPGSDLEFMREHYFARHNIDYAILSPLYPTAQGDTNQDFSAAMIAAVNDWQIANWTSRERRCRSSILVPMEDAAAAVAEIERYASQPDFVQVLLLTRAIEPLGRRRFWPIYEAAAAHDLPVAIHVFGYSGHPVTGTGWPSYYLEEMTGHAAACQAAITSLVLEGVFERLPQLKVVTIEGGFGWLPALAWRLDQHWQRLRAEVPHLRQPPSEYLRRQLWATTQPIEEPPRQAQLMDVIAWIGLDRLLFATDYPHWDFDDPLAAVPARLTPAERRQLISGNALALYRLG